MANTQLMDNIIGAHVIGEGQAIGETVHTTHNCLAYVEFQHMLDDVNKQLIEDKKEESIYSLLKDCKAGIFI
ncbi:MAG: hypothetical protein PF904_12275 [Kiritimatiellae bacterium]|jgi:hypothetical protein|nr:hypothetical protein [Kiritimatiellia bacterium]